MFPIFAGNSASTGYNLTRSVRLRASASAYLGRTFSTPTNNKIYTVSAWVKLGKIAALNRFMCTDQTAAPATFMYFDSNSQFVYYDWQGGSANYVMTGTPVYRDPSSWYHLVIAVDTTQATDTNRVKVYLNNTQITLTSSGSGWIPQNTNTGMNSAKAQNIGRSSDGNYFDGYMAEINFIDGQALTPSSFGSTNALTGVWQPARYTGTYGTNGFYLPFTDNSALTTSSNVGLGKDFSGNGNYWTTNNISITSGVTYDSMTDVPTLTSATAANFAVLNPLNNVTAYNTISNGNMTATVVGGAASFYGVPGTMYVNSGKYYFEVKKYGTNYTMIGVATTSASNTEQYGTPTQTWTYFSTGTKFGNGSGGAGLSYGSGYGNGDVVGVALDMNAGTLTFYLNGTSQGVAFNTGLSGQLLAPWVANYNVGIYCDVNFGQQPFAYTPPTGYVALNTFNLPTPTILAGNKYMDATLYTGTGAALSVTNAGAFKPDWVWTKSRSAATDHKLTDSVRGVTKALTPLLGAAGQTTDTNGLTAFNSNGFTLGSDTTYNNSGATYVGWQWQAGQGTTSSNTSGSITSTVSVNATAGFSIATYTGTGVAATVGHGLGVAPSMIIVKAYANAGDSWQVYHASLGNTTALILEKTDAQLASSSLWWNNTSPTSSVYSMSTSGYVNRVSTAYIAYCFAPIAGYSAFGSYTGNGSADGPFVYTGFRPALIIVKRTDTTGNWCMFDDKRLGYNGASASKELYSNLSSAEGTSNGPDQLSNGFKFRDTYSDVNASGGTYIYMAFAENPFKYALAR